jgi:pimeloyl-ACP methyl ester carboxylesterase
MDQPPDLPGVTHEMVATRDGVRLHVARAGDGGRAVLLLHGWPQHWWMWRHLIEALRPDHRVLAVDLRGFGWSDAPAHGYRKDELARDVQALLDPLGLDEVDLVGHDWGGYITYLLAGWEPHRVRRAVVLSAPPPHAKVGLRDVPGLRGFAHMPVLSAPVIGRRAAGSAAFLKLVERLAGGTWDDESRRLYLERFTAHPDRARAASRVYRTFVTREAIERPAAPRPQQPILALHGERDPVPRSLNAAAEVVPGAGHWLAEEQPELVNARIRTFLAD